VGFTLGAGGARGLAHLGVFRAAEEQGLPVDCLSGTSIGAVFGALAGMGHDATAMREAAQRLVLARPFRDFTLPTTALLSGRRFERLADEFFGSADLSDLWLPMVTVTCELGNFLETVHRAGSLRDILLAGTVLPGVLPPRILDDRLHIDGGTSNMLPVALLRAHSPGPIVAIDVSPWDEIPVPSSHYPIGADAVLARLRGKPLLGALEVFWRAVSYGVAGRAREEGAIADLLIVPDVGSVGTSDLHGLREIETAGYVAARAAFSSERGRKLQGPLRPQRET
jgi:predicted acylesterase/phospholipase RssA